MKKTRIGVVGIGHLGSRHLKVYSQLPGKVDIIGACDLQVERATRLARQYNAPFIKDYRELAGKVDAVNI